MIFDNSRFRKNTLLVAVVVAVPFEFFVRTAEGKDFEPHTEVPFSRQEVSVRAPSVYTENVSAHVVTGGFDPPAVRETSTHAEARHSVREHFPPSFTVSEVVSRMSNQSRVALRAAKFQRDSCQQKERRQRVTVRG